MKNKSLILVIVLFALILGAAVILYPTLSEKALTQTEPLESSVTESDNITPGADTSEEETTAASEESTVINNSQETEKSSEDTYVEEITKEALTEELTEEKTTSAVQYRKAENFNFFDSEGNAVNLDDFKGKPVILNFWATWCGYCIKEMPDFQKAYEEYGEEIQFLIINTDDSISDGEKFINSKGYTFPTYYDLDREATITYSITGIPRTIAIDKDGNLIYNRAGMINETQLQSIIESIL